jgi:cyclopropane fatty-acyl-phospholipid synthase-like methyltransferase
MTRKEQIKSAYKLTGSNASFYDGMMTYSTIPGKAICRIVWNMDGEKNLRYLEKALAGIPEDFSGKLLEVPVGTGVLTMPVYRDLPDADITCLDYSENMMASAQEKAKVLGLSNIKFLQGDVGALPCFPAFIRRPRSRQWKESDASAARSKGVSGHERKRSAD